MRQNPYEPPKSDTRPKLAQEYQEPLIDWAGLILVLAIFLSVIILTLMFSYYISWLSPIASRQAAWACTSILADYAPWAVVGYEEQVQSTLYLVILLIVYILLTKGDNTHEEFHNWITHYT